MSVQFVDEAQCNPRAMESVREGKAQLLFISLILALNKPIIFVTDGVADPSFLFFPLQSSDGGGAEGLGTRVVA